MQGAAWSVGLIAVYCVVGVAAADDSSTGPNQLQFNRDIRPLLSEYCFACHGPDGAARKAELRLDERGGAVESGAVVPGKASESELIARIQSSDPDEVMPPPASGKKLKPEHKQRLAQWINQGAKWQRHWAFIPPRRPSLPKGAGAEGWAINPIDYFIYQRLRRAGLEPNLPADRTRLARRAALDVTGLPPDRELLAKFRADAQQGAYARYVDALLASPHSGEHRARYWLDAARYGDTHGMHVDNYREIWPYRDWVIKAFNDNMPFDRFVVEQIAGDLLPTPTLDQRIATGFNRCNITTSEGGAIPAELDVRYMVDRVETTATVFLGLTAGCAVCHDHKYDPISQREFYQFGAFFNNTTQPAMDGNQKDTPPVVTLPAKEFRKEWKQLHAERRRLRAALVERTAGAAAWWPDRERSLRHPVAADALAVWLPLTEGEGESLELPGELRWAEDHPAGRRGVRFGNQGQLTAALPPLRTDESLTVSFWIRTPDQVMAMTVLDQSGKTKDDKPAGWKITVNTQGALIFEMNDGHGKKVRGLLPDNEALRPRTWQHVCVRYSGGQSNSSVSILVNGQAGALRNSSEAHIEATELVAAPLKIGGRMPSAALSDLRIFRRWLTDEETRLLAAEPALKQQLAGDKSWQQFGDDDRQRLTSYYGHTQDPVYRQLVGKFAATQRRRDFIYARSTTTLVMQERPSRPRAWVLERGQYTERREQVAPGVPGALPPLPKDVPRNRLGLAQWLVRPDHPLTARVMVNRMWQSVFGTGLVRTSEDFGVMGEPPSHPELLDWLAVEFIESGWNVKYIMKLMLTSQTYRQSAMVTPARHLKDPQNRLLSRGPRLRLDAEVLRDQVLAVSGLLVRKVGGPSVKPYQPSGLWKVVAITGSNTREFQRDSGAALYRRSVYTFWKRTSPPPSMAAFNAPTREQCTVRRERTNTPLQALVMLNDPQYVEAARFLAERTIKQAVEAKVRAAWLLEEVLRREADPRDVADLVAAAGEFQQVFAADKQAAEKLLKTGDTPRDEKLEPALVAAWTLIANTLMNRDDFLTK